MAIVVELIKRKNEKPFLAEVNNVNDIELNDGVLFSQENNTDFGIVVKKPFEKDCSKIKNISKIISRANNQDWEKYNDILKKEKDAFPKIINAVEKLGLELKLIDVKISFDLSKMIVSYTADDRVDFRELVRMLAGIFKMRVELKQIGARDEAKFCGGYGCCGQELCCRKFLTDYKQVTIKMAKAQNIALMPNKINGVCGKLMCCLEYEYNTYKELSEKMPALNSTVKYNGTDVVVVFQDLLKQTLTVKIPVDDGFELKNIELSELD